MINLTVALKEVPYSILKDLTEVLEQAKLNNMRVDASINYDVGYVYIDVEVDEHIKIFAISQVVDVIDYAGVGEFVIEIGVE